MEIIFQTEMISLNSFFSSNDQFVLIYHLHLTNKTNGYCLTIMLRMNKEKYYVKEVLK